MDDKKNPREKYLEYKREQEERQFQEIIDKPELSPVELWILTSRNYREWCKQNYYPKLLDYFRKKLPKFGEWQKHFDLEDSEIMECGITFFIEPKRFLRKKKLYLTRAKTENHEVLFVANKNRKKDTKDIFGFPAKYTVLKEFLSYSDWCKKNKIEAKILNITMRRAPGHKDERTYLDGEFELLKMGGVRIPEDGINLLDRGKHLEFVNLCSLSLTGSIYYGESESLKCSYCAVDHLRCFNLDMGLPRFEHCSMDDTKISKSNIQQWIFYDCMLDGEILDSNLRMIKIYGGNFRPIVRNTFISEIDAEDIKATNSRMAYIYKTLKTIYAEQGDDKKGVEYFLKEKELERKSSSFLKSLGLMISYLYWGHGRKPVRILASSSLLIIVFAVIYAYLLPDYFHLSGSNCEMTFLDSLYISSVSYTTLGFGDVNPIGIARIFVAFESLFGAASIGFLVAGYSHFKY